MEPGDIVWLLIVGFWLLSGVLSRLARLAKRGRQPAGPEPSQPAQSSESQLEPATVPAPPHQRRPPARQPPPVPEPAKTPEDALTDLLKTFGVEVPKPSPDAEQPVASEHRHTEGWHDRTPSEIRRTESEHTQAPGWHQQAESEISKTASEHRHTEDWHELTASEHARGDVRRARYGGPVKKRPRKERVFARQLVTSLRGDRDSLAQAILMKEILGPPVGMRESADGPSER